MIEEIEQYFDRLWPICRSITGNGLRESFSILQEIIPLELSEIPTGTKVLDWTIPNEWNIEEAYLIDPNGEKVIDFHQNNLHILNYSEPFEGELSWEELLPHLYYKKEQPDAIPYITSYYSRKWGFCLSFDEFVKLPKFGKYKVVIKSTLQNGSLTYGDLVLKGDSNKEILFSSYLCHPSMANNELSGPLTLAFLYRQLSKKKNLKYTYRFVIAPETIGVIAYLDRYGDKLKESLIGGCVITCCGDRKSLGFKHSRKSNSLMDHLVKEKLNSKYNFDFQEQDFEPNGSDERQYCSPGFNLPVVTLFRSKYSEYKEYHTSLDDKNFLSFESIEENVVFLIDNISSIENYHFYINTMPYGEPQLGKRDLYEDLLSKSSHSDSLLLRMRMLSFCDGEFPMAFFIAKYGYSTEEVAAEVEVLLNSGILKELYV